MFHLALLLLALSCYTLADAKVLLEDKFTPTYCSCFFYKGTEPTGIIPPDGARICQRFANKYRFATVYDRKRRIPTYSAYIYEAKMSVRTKWMIEPQLVSQSYSETMELERCTKIPKKLLRESQAVDEDYKSASKTYDRGHINPSLHHNDGFDSKATFTLTNVVPQNRILNQGAWKKYEEDTIRNRAEGCSRTYAIVGAIPGNNAIANRVNIPGYLWAAACCTMANHTVRAWAVIAENSNKNKVDPITIQSLEAQISQSTGGSVRLFHDDCPRNV
ncbi:endonuclease domain-containing 1 protein-like [Pleurodeles waltl]|uniref:endonuclease domain-containing 1 protein-like n=1 Tax=Pleurodeles waltl TaxID=8319 RepID=UPI003709BA5C